MRNRPRVDLLAGQSAQHPLVRIASVNLVRKGSTQVLDVEMLTEWLAQRIGVALHAHRSVAG